MQLKLLFLPVLFSTCGLQGEKPANYRQRDTIVSMKRTPATIAEIPVPEGFTRVETDSSSMGHWLRKLSLKQDKTVYLYNGEKKPNQQAQFAVIDWNIGNQNLMQCADAAMSLYAHYLFDNRRYNDIRFYDYSGKQYAFSAPFTKTQLNSFLPRVYAMCGTASLSKQLKKIPMSHLKPGDVLLRGGFPGHAITVVDMAENDRHEKIYLFAQGYMPAQDLHVLNNFANEPDNPWYSLSEGADIVTPEFTFNCTEARRW